MSADANPYTVTGLTNVTTYDFYVQADCGGITSDWVGPLTLKTGVYNMGVTGSDTLTTCGSYIYDDGGPDVHMGGLAEVCHGIVEDDLQRIKACAVVQNHKTKGPGITDAADPAADRDLLIQIAFGVPVDLPDRHKLFHRSPPKSCILPVFSSHHRTNPVRNQWIFKMGGPSLARQPGRFVPGNERSV